MRDWAPRFDDQGAVTEPARVTVLQNGIAVQNNTIIKGPTWGEKFGAKYMRVGAPEPCVAPCVIVESFR